MSIKKALRLFVLCAGCLLIFALLWWAVDYAAPGAQITHALKVVLIVLGVCVAIGGILYMMGKQPPLG